MWRWAFFIFLIVSIQSIAGEKPSYYSDDDDDESEQDVYRKKSEIPYWDKRRFKKECKKWYHYSGHWVRLKNGHLKFIIDHEWYSYECVDIPKD